MLGPKKRKKKEKKKKSRQKKKKRVKLNEKFRGVTIDENCNEEGISNFFFFFSFQNSGNKITFFSDFRLILIVLLHINLKSMTKFQSFSF